MRCDSMCTCVTTTGRSRRWSTGLFACLYVDACMCICMCECVCVRPFLEFSCWLIINWASVSKFLHRDRTFLATFLDSFLDRSSSVVWCNEERKEWSYTPLTHRPPYLIHYPFFLIYYLFSPRWGSAWHRHCIVVHWAALTRVDRTRRYGV